MGETLSIYHNYDEANLTFWSEKKNNNHFKLLKYTFYFSFSKHKCSSCKTGTYLTTNEFKRTGAETAPLSIYGIPNIWSWTDWTVTHSWMFYRFQQLSSAMQLICSKIMESVTYRIDQCHTLCSDWRIKPNRTGHWQNRHVGWTLHSDD